MNWLHFEVKRAKVKVTSENSLLVAFSHHKTLNNDSLN